MSRVLFTDSYVTLSIDDARGLVRYVRSGTPFTSLNVVRTIHFELGEAIPARAGLKLLLDFRKGPSRNDPEFEKEIMRAFGPLLRKFEAHAVLVRTAAGRLQATRLERQHNPKAPGIFASEADALRFLGTPTSRAG